MSKCAINNKLVTTETDNLIGCGYLLRFIFIQICGFLIN
jgi:hypothetical protein